HGTANCGGSLRSFCRLSRRPNERREAIWSESTRSCTPMKFCKGGITHFAYIPKRSYGHFVSNSSGHMLVLTKASVYNTAKFCSPQIGEHFGWPGLAKCRDEQCARCQAPAR